MQCFLDDQPYEAQGVSLSEILDDASAHLAPAGRMVVEVRLDGESLGSEALDTHHEADMTGRKVELLSADTRLTAIETLEAAKIGLDHIRSLQDEAAEMLQADRPAEAMPKVGEALALWQQVSQTVLFSAQVVELDLQSQVVDGRNFVDVSNDLAQQIRDLGERIIAGDGVAIADAMAYEWSETVEIWRGVLDHMSRAIENPS